MTLPRVLGKNVLAYEMQTEEQQVVPGKLIVLNEKEEQKKYRVVGIGNEVSQVKVDDEIIFGPYTTKPELAHENKVYIVVPEHSILAVL